MDNKYLIRRDVTEGMHIYFNIKNFADITEKETYNNVVLLFQAIDLLLRQTERDIAKYEDKVYIEKVTDSRFHCVIENNPKIADFFYLLISSFFKNVEIINERINRFKKLDDLIINVGCDYGKYVDYTINFASLNEDNDIGFPCNKAAKIQNEAEDNEILISQKAFRRLLECKSAMPFNQINKERHVLEGTAYYDVFYSIKDPNWEDMNKIVSVPNPFDSVSDFMRQVESLNNQTDSQISSFATKIKVISNSAVSFCDIRGFTKKFKEDGSNLVSMASKAVASLERMYMVNSKEMKHIQFQGDRELYVREDGKVGKAISTALQLIDDFKNNRRVLLEDQTFAANDIAIGIGISFGQYYQSNVGYGSAKSPLLVGRVPQYANIAEDKYAALPFQVALHKSAYLEAIKEESSPLSKTVKAVFVRTTNPDYYVIKAGMNYEEYKNLYRKFYEETNNLSQRNDGGKPWSR